MKVRAGRPIPRAVSRRPLTFHLYIIPRSYRGRARAPCRLFPGRARPEPAVIAGYKDPAEIRPLVTRFATGGTVPPPVPVPSSPLSLSSFSLSLFFSFSLSPPPLLSLSFTSSSSLSLFLLLCFRANAHACTHARRICLPRSARTFTSDVRGSAKSLARLPISVPIGLSSRARARANGELARAAGRCGRSEKYDAVVSPCPPTPRRLVVASAVFNAVFRGLQV